jgi:microcystin-dependent protein
MSDTAHRIVSTSILQDIADGIRAKTGGSSPIVVEDFSTEIATIDTAPIPVGIIYPYAGSTAPSKYLLCDGSAVSRTDYSDLYDVIGTTYGAGDGSTTFNIPDLSGKVIVGVSSTHTLGSTGGEESHTLLETELPSHVHEVPKHGHGNDIAVKTPQLSHSITQPAFTYNKPGSTTKFLTASGGTAAYTGTSSATATRSTSVAITAHAATACTKSGSISDKAAFNTNTTGSGAAHNNMQPYQVINYIIYAGV